MKDPEFNPYHKWLAIPKDVTQPNCYQLLGVPLFENDPEVISTAADSRMMILKTFQTGVHEKLVQRILNEVSAARVRLLNPERRARYDEKLRKQLAADSAKSSQVTDELALDVTDELSLDETDESLDVNEKDTLHFDLSDSAPSENAVSFELPVSEERQSDSIVGLENEFQFDFASDKNEGRSAEKAVRASRTSVGKTAMSGSAKVKSAAKPPIAKTVGTGLAIESKGPKKKSGSQNPIEFNITAISNSSESRVPASKSRSFNSHSGSGSRSQVFSSSDEFTRKPNASPLKWVVLAGSALLVVVVFVMLSGSGKNSAKKRSIAKTETQATSVESRTADSTGPSPSGSSTSGSDAAVSGVSASGTVDPSKEQTQDGKKQSSRTQTEEIALEKPSANVSQTDTENNGGQLEQNAQNPVLTATGRQQAKMWREKLKAPADNKAGTRVEVKLNGIDYAFRWCPSGKFLMGKVDGKMEHASEDSVERGCDRQHKVTLTQGFWMLEIEVTQAMWKDIMGNNPSCYQGDDLPVEQVTWEDCQQFCQRLSDLVHVMVQLPTEAQWEYACRAGTTTTYYFGDSPDELWKYGNYLDQSCTADLPWIENKDTAHNDGADRSVPGRRYQPNAWGLYDMYGNVSEWCEDWIANYPQNAVTDPIGMSPTNRHAIRGFCWDCTANLCNSVLGNGWNANKPHYATGFRFIVLVPTVLDLAKLTSEDSDDDDDEEETNTDVADADADETDADAKANDANADETDANEKEEQKVAENDTEEKNKGDKKLSRREARLQKLRSKEKNEGSSDEKEADSRHEKERVAKTSEKKPRNRRAQKNKGTTKRFNGVVRAEYFIEPRDTPSTSTFQKLGSTINQGDLFNVKGMVINREGVFYILENGGYVCANEVFPTSFLLPIEMKNVIESMPRPAGYNEPTYQPHQRRSNIGIFEW